MRESSVKEISVVIPVYNEEKIVKQKLSILLKKLSDLDVKDYEILVIENGSTDNTKKLLKKLSSKNNKLRTFFLKEANYGKALKKGIKEAKFENVFQFDIDFIDSSFLTRGLKEKSNFDILVGSKLLPGSKDQRPQERRIITRLMSFLVRLLGYQGTDTHGNKMYKKSKISSTIDKVEARHHFFDTELLMRAQKLNINIKEIPVTVKEIRKTRFPFFARLYQTILGFNDLKIRARKFAKDPNYYRFLADDYGYSKKSDRKIEQLFKKEKLDEIGVLSNFLKQKRGKSKFLKGKKVFLHANFVERFPVSNPREIKSLVDGHGKFYSRYVFLLRMFLGQIETKDLVTELTSQYEYLSKLGPKIVGVSSHDHMHAFSPIAEVVSKFAKKNNLSVRLYGDFKPYTLRAKVVFLLMKLMAFLSHFVYFRKWKLPPTWRRGGLPMTFMSLEDKMPDLRYLLVVHPGLPFDRTKQYEGFF